MSALKAFFDFLIYIEDVKMENPFKTYESKPVGPTVIRILGREDWDKIIKTVTNVDSIVTLKNGEKKNLFRPYLIDGFKLGLFTGMRREEIVSLKWKDILINAQGYPCISVNNLKVERIKKKDGVYKTIPINPDLYDLLMELGWESYKGADQYILAPYRTESVRTIADALSKGFSFYRRKAGISDEIGFKHLRKTYITWLDYSMGKETGILTSQSGETILRHYRDPNVIGKTQEASLKFKVFGN